MLQPVAPLHLSMRRTGWFEPLENYSRNRVEAMGAARPAAKDPVGSQQ